MRFLILCLFAAFSACAQIAPPRQTWQVETSKNLVRPLDLRYGETVDLEVCLVNYGAAIDLSAATNIVLHAQTNGMDGASFQLSGSKGRRGAEADAASGWVWVRVPVDSWLPDLTGATATYTLEVTDGTTRILRTSGPLRVSGSAAAAAGQPLPPLALLAVQATASNALATAQAAAAASSNAQSTADGKLGPTDYAPGLVAKLAVPPTNTLRMVESTWGQIDLDWNGSYYANTNRDVRATPAVLGGSNVWYVGEFNNQWYIVWPGANWNPTNAPAEQVPPTEGDPPFPLPLPSMVWAPAIPAVTLSNLVGTVEINTDDIRELVQQIEALPSVPTNVIQGWVMYDSGSNVWIQITVSNLTFWGDFIDE